MGKSIKVMALLLATFIMVGSLAACGSDKTGNVDIEQDLGIDKKSLKEETLTLYFPGEEPRNYKEIVDEIQKRTKNDINTKLDFKWVYWPDYFIRIKTLISSNEPCDAFYYYCSPGGVYRNDEIYRFDNMAKNGLLRDISELFPKAAPKYFSKFSEEEINSVSYGGKIYAVPNNFPRTSRRCVLVRDDLMEKYNISDIKSYDDYERYLEAVGKNEPDITPMSLNDTLLGLFAEAYGYVVLDYRQGLVYKWDDPDMKVMAWEQVPEYKDAVNHFVKWNKEGYLIKDVSFAQNPDDTVVLSGKFASLINSQGMAEYFNPQVKSKGFTWSYKEYQLYPEGISERTDPLNRGVFAFNPNSQKSERVMTFMEWMQLNQENYDLVMYGVEGRNYSLKDNQMTFPDASKLIAGWSGSWALENIDYLRTTTASDPDYKKKYIENILTTTKYVPHLGFYIDFAPVSQEVELRDSFFFKLENDIYSGTFNKNSVNEYIKEQKERGIDKIVAEVQRQLDKWRNENN